MENNLVGINRRSFQDSKTGEWIDMTTLYVVHRGVVEDGLEGDMVGTYTIMRDRCDGLRLGPVDLSYQPTRDGKLKVSAVRNVEPVKKVG